MAERQQWDDVPARLRALRERREITQQALAMQAGTSVRVVAKYETPEEFPKTGPDLSTLAKFAEVLGVTTSFLLFGDEVHDHAPPSDDARLSDELLAGLRALGVVPTQQEIRWLSTAPFFKDMGAAGAFQAIMGNRHGQRLTEGQIEAASEARRRHHSDDVPRKRR